METLVNLYRALGDANRLSILQMLSGQELSVCEIMLGLNLSQPAVSHHLKILRQAQLVKNVKYGKLVLYTLNACGLQKIHPLVDKHLGDLLHFALSRVKPSALRETPNYCELVGLKKSICEQDI
ncbi:ArsR/SmtB family transcription factor [Desulforamulus hydrothermalis]|uniref:Transcriptional regulator, ArsR family n=1 Tax=Desulforamulus hydrothermalis Lam5 = DSM 18033 TaxID=1121428 RepID=K8DX56_9FIRM|nr:metalloregulator ArsR/SmtB family transcription factor [Desulforamulus hydrothermalis]CCO07094.1 Transcriptional regulator, ArsR family [Desulforamulus hydrothermalis Lam5 = DSM 18033]SHG90304.1 transcriptional regulator, ArsR family [Desulforamulus hydrothermalis Lam5 = DSM 18033]